MDSEAPEGDSGYQEMCGNLLSNNFSQDLVSPDTPTPNYAFSYYVAGPLMTIFLVIGLLGNSACLYVFKPCKKSASGGTPPIYIYLFALATWDLILLWSSFLLYNLPELTRGSILTNSDYVTTRPYIYCATNAAHTGSNWVVVALGLERYIALCFPFKHRLLDNGRRRAAYVVIGISIAAILYSLPRLFEVLYEFSSVPECVLNEDGTYEASSQTSVRQNVLYRTLYKIVGGTVLYSVGPFLCLLIVSIRVSAAIRQQRSFRNATLQQRCCNSNQSKSAYNRRDHQNNQSRDNCSHSINIMLVAVVVKLLIVHTLPTGLDVAEMAMGDEKFSDDQIIEYLINFLSLLLAINSSCNFFIYYVCSKRFRNELPRFCVIKMDPETSDTLSLCCRSRRYQETCVTTSLGSTVIVNDTLVDRVNAANV